MRELRNRIAEYLSFLAMHFIATRDFRFRHAEAFLAAERMDDLNNTIEVLLLNFADELAKPEGEQGPDIAELACVYERLTGWTVQQELADHPNPWGTT